MLNTHHPRLKYPENNPAVPQNRDGKRPMINIDFENIATDKSVRENLQKAAETAITESSAE